VDEHAVVLDASPERAWTAVGEVVRRTLSSDRAGLAARVLGCRHADARGSPLESGSTIPGFRVDRAEPPTELVLAGEHRFSRYALTFRIDPVHPGRTRVSAETRASFPGAHGRAYRALVVSTRGHVVAVRRLLRSIGRSAERAERSGTTVP
jgi:hypothetical protein